MIIILSFLFTFSEVFCKVLYNFYIYSLCAVGVGCICLDYCYTTCYRLGIKWYDKVTNEYLLVKTGQAKIEDEIRKRKWRWIGHTVRKPQGAITRQALSWNLQGMRKRGRPKNTQRRDLEKDKSKIGKSWREL
jgi:hypothetical protein